jgi:hypothetical protein
LSGRYELLAAGTADVEAVEVSVHWTTEGKGDEDLGVHHFEKHVRGDGTVPPAEGAFAAPLPRSPLSYDGVLVKVLWRAHVRVTLRGGRRETGEAFFHLGDVTPAAEVHG